MGWILLDLAGSVALLLWGVHMVQTGVERAFGPELRRFLRTRLRNRLAAFLSGLGVTAVLQSSTATGLMVTGLAAGGAIGLEAALAVMLGANVGTTLIVQVLSFDVAAIAPGLILIGVIAFRRTDQGRTRDLGRVAIGLGLMLMALHQLLDIAGPITASPMLDSVLQRLSNTPVIAALLGAILAWAAHSSVAIVLLIGSLASKGVVPPILAIALVTGANLGTAVNPLLEGAGSDPVARRLPMGNLLTRCVGFAIVIPLLDWIAPLFARLEPEPARAVADFHSLFNLVLAIAFLPFLHPYAALLRRLLPARAEADDPGRPRYLNMGAQDTPSIALAAAAREALRLADAFEAILMEGSAALSAADRRRINEVRRRDDVLDRLNASIRDYLAGIRLDVSAEGDERRAAEILRFITNLESAGDALDRLFLAPLARRLKRGLPFPESEREQACGLLERLAATTRSAAAVFMTEDPRAARSLMAEKETFRELEAAATAGQFATLRGEGSDETPALQIDMLHALKQINGYLVAAAAYPVLEGQGELLRSRLRAEL